LEKLPYQPAEEGERGKKVIAVIGWHYVAGKKGCPSS
jgi:hypothetical protein